MTRVVDSTMPWLEAALDRSLAEAMLRRPVSLDALAADSLTLHSARLLRHLPGRRAIVEYTIDAFWRGTRRGVRLIGKSRAKGLDRETIRVVSSLHDNGFSADSPDGISVPGVVTVVPEWRMWVSPKVEGPRVADGLAGAGGVLLAARVADVASKIHCSGVVARRRHSMSDELAVLESVLGMASSAWPGLAQRIEVVWHSCRALALAAVAGQIGAIHRDFYGDQIVVAGGRLFVLDFDQFSEGDAELDVGNFMAHLTEQAIRLDGCSQSMDDVRKAMCERAVESGVSRELIMVYDLLTLARHIWISTRIADRNHVTEKILAECENRLQLAELGVGA